MALVRAADGTANLHIWREGREYLHQKGPTFLTQWNNLIFAVLPGPPLANTRYVDLSTAPLGFAEETFDAAYAYHVFEHLTPSEGERCVQQIFSVLKAGGILRISVPDLEAACRHYLDTLDAAGDQPAPQSLVRYRWAVMAIFEQMVRDRSGGGMLDALQQGEYDIEQLRHMFGDMLQPALESIRSSSSGAARDGRPAALTFLRRIYRRARAIRGRSGPSGADRRHPLATKEAVRWMYDRLSLRLLFEQAGFEDVRQMDHLSSSIPGWPGYDFDRSNHGDYPLDPSVYVEGRKPERPRRAT